MRAARETETDRKIDSEREGTRDNKREGAREYLEQEKDEILLNR